MKLITVNCNIYITKISVVTALVFFAILGLYQSTRWDYNCQLDRSGQIMCFHEDQITTDIIRQLSSNEGVCSYEVYKKIWKQQIASGNPKIRLVDEAVPWHSSKDAMYQPFRNTVFLEKNKRLDFLIKELPHSKQFNETPFWASYMFVRDQVILTKKVVFRKPKSLAFMVSYYQEEYNKYYSVIGSFEYHAHSVLEPKIRNTFEKEVELADYLRQNFPFPLPNREEQVKIIRIELYNRRAWSIS